MSRQIGELEIILQQMIVEQKKLSGWLEKQQAAMTVCDVKKMDDARHAAEAVRVRLLGLESRRRIAVAQIAAVLKLPSDPTLARIAAAFPQRSAELSKLRQELKGVTEQVKTRTYVATRVAGAVLGHLNVVVRLIAGAGRKQQVYTRGGMTRPPGRVGVIEAVG